MTVGDKQKLITNIVATVLNERAQTDITFDWFINKHTKEHFGKCFVGSFVVKTPPTPSREPLVATLTDHRADLN